MVVYNRVNYTQRLLRESVLKKYKSFLAECKESEKVVYGDSWTLGAIKDVIMERFCTW